MDKRKYLAALFVLFLEPKSAGATAWIPKLDSYKISFTILLTNNSLNNEKRQRADLLHKIEQLIYRLENKLRNTDTSSARYYLILNIIKSVVETIITPFVWNKKSMVKVSLRTKNYFVLFNYFFLKEEIKIVYGASIC